MSSLLDEGSWLFGAILVVILTGILQQNLVTQQVVHNAPAAQEAMERQEEDPGIYGTQAWKILASNRYSVFTTLLGLMIFFVPAAILTAVALEPLGAFSVVLYRDFGSLTTCTLMAWTAAHLPLALASFAIPPGVALVPGVFAPWIAAKLLFIFLAACAARTLFGAEWPRSVLIAAGGLAGLTGGFYVAQILGPSLGFLASPFLLYWLYMAFGRDAQRSWGDLSAGFRSRANFRRQLDAAAVNPHDADPHYQLGLIYQKRRQTAQAVEEFQRAVAIDPTEADAQYQLGRIAREQGRLDEAMVYCQTALRLNDKHSFSEVLREIGAIHLHAGRIAEAEQCLTKFLDRREYDAEGLYLLGETMLKLNRPSEAKELFRRTVEAVKTLPPYRRGLMRRWASLAQSEYKRLA